MTIKEDNDRKQARLQNSQAYPERRLALDLANFATYDQDDLLSWFRFRAKDCQNRPAMFTAAAIVLQSHWFSIFAYEQNWTVVQNPTDWQAGYLATVNPEIRKDKIAYVIRQLLQDVRDNRWEREA